ncbi:MAG: amidohydrolase family protein [Roseburia sp.]|nr:amidohydrolase family protein [Roseburia sp.]
MIIDFHTHTFPESISSKVIHKLSMAAATKAFTDGSLSGLLSSMKEAGIDYSVNLPVMTSPEQVEKINASMLENRETLFSQGIIAFGGLHPDYQDYKKELRRLKAGGILGIKLHPAYQNVDLTDIRMLRIIEAAAAEDLIILIHAGIDIGLYEHNYSSVPQILRVIREIAPKYFVLAHMGNWGCWDEVESDLAGALVYLDTAFAIGPVTAEPAAGRPPVRNFNLTEEQFLRIIRKHGTDKILFATDSPWENQKDYLNRIRQMSLTEEEQKQILGDNAAKLLRLS